MSFQQPVMRVKYLFPHNVYHSRVFLMIFRSEIYSLVMKIYKFVCFAMLSVIRNWHRIARRLADEEMERNWVKDVVD